MCAHSLFPAYSKASSSEPQNVAKEDSAKEWLQNSSFTPDLIPKLSAHEGEHSSVGDSGAEEAETLYAEDSAASQKRSKKRKKKTKAKSPQEGEAVYEKSALLVIEEKDSIQSRLKKLVFIEDTGLSLERAYRLDVSCDYDNYTLGCLDRQDIAKYNSKGKIPLGLLPHEALLWSKNSKKKKTKSDSRYFSRLFKVSSEESVSLCTVQNDLSHHLADYIPICKISDGAVKKADGVQNFDGVSTNWKTHSDSVREGTETKSSGNDTEHAQLQSPVEHEVTEKIAAYNKRLKENPQNVNLWLQFISFQDEVFRILSCYKNVSGLEQSVFEKKVAIFDRAQEHNPNSLELTVAKLEVCKGFWETEKLLSSWEQMLFLHPNNASVWSHYIMFVLSNFSYFTIPRIVKVYSKCLKTLRNIYEGHFQSHTAPSDILEDMLDIFSQLCCILLESGYNERALGTFQALIEFNLFTPSVDHTLSCEEWITLFETFWDCGVPRFGEDNAVGWSAAISKKQVYTNTLVNSEDMNALEDDILSQKFPQWKTWLEFEHMRASHCWIPWRPNPALDQTSEDCEDQDRTVSFEDFAEILFMLPSEDLKFRLLCKFLNFLGVELHTPNCSSFSKKGKISQLFFGSFNALTELITTIIPHRGSSDMLKLSSSGKCNDLSTFISNVFLQAKTVFSKKYFNLLSLMQIRHMMKTTLRDTNEVTRRQGLKYLKKYAKSLLKESHSRNCLFLWTEYIFIEWTMGNKTEAEDTFENLLVASSHSGVSGDQYKMMIHFATSCIKLFTGMKTCFNSKNLVNEHCKNRKFAWIMAHVGGNIKYDKWKSSENLQPTLILKASSVLKTFIDDEWSFLMNCNNIACCCLSPYSFAIVSFMECLVFLQYFAQDPTSAINVFRKILEDLPTKLKCVSCVKVSQEIEQQLYVSYGELLNYHTWSTANPLKPLRCFLFEAVEKFPDNACLLHLLTSLKSASSVIGHVRRFFHKLMHNNSDLSPIAWLFSIASELAICYSIQEPMAQLQITNVSSKSDVGSPTFVCGLTWKIRSLFEKALQCPSSQHCVALWRAYGGFEIMLGEYSRAKKIFHQSLQNCAWAKVLLMDAIEYFPDDFMSILNVISEKQLRIHTPVEEVTLLMGHLTNTNE